MVWVKTNKFHRGCDIIRFSRKRYSMFNYRCFFNRKAEELYRLIDIRSGSTGAVNVSSTCQAVICLELACLQYSDRIDRVGISMLSLCFTENYA